MFLPLMKKNLMGGNMGQTPKLVSFSLFLAMIRYSALPRALVCSVLGTDNILGAHDKNIFAPL